MSDVKRYDWDRYDGMYLDERGDWVDFDDYAALAARLAEAEAERDALRQRLAEAEALLDSAAVVIANTCRGSTHWEGCADVHPACGTLKAIDIFRRAPDSATHRESDV